MTGILFAKWKIFLRKPWDFVLFTAMSILFAFIIGGSNDMNTLKIPVYADEISDNLDASLEELEGYHFSWLDDEAKLKELVENGKAELGVILRDKDFEIIVGMDSPNVSMVEYALAGIYEKRMEREKLTLAIEDFPKEEQEKLSKEWDSLNDNPVFSVQSSTFRSDDAIVYDSNYHFLFGFTLFFVIYTIGYTVLPVLTEKQAGIWDRMILSPARKWEMYVANLANSFLQGYLQIIVIFLVFRYAFGLDFHGKMMETLLLILPYVFTVVALSMFLVSVVKTVQQFNGVLPIVSLSMAMIGGAYWPLEIVESEILLTLSKGNPLTYGMEIVNGVVMYGYPMEELLFPISILLCLGVVFMGMGIHLMERRHI